MKSILSLILVLILSLFFLLPQQGLANEDNLLDMSIEDLLGMDMSEEKEGITIYGYMSTNVERVFGELSVEDGQTMRTDAPMEWSLPHFHLFLQSNLSKNIKTFVNIAAEELEVRNMWGNIKIDERLQVKFGKIYRKFGLFNEKLDEVPTYLGIEPPELFDKDHLLLPRLTTFVVHGDFKFDNHSFSYNLSTDNGEGGPSDGLFPLGWDLRAKIAGKAMVGLSGYFSSISNGAAEPEVEVGDGSPTGGVLPWMESDDYSVFGGFAEINVQNFLIKGAYWIADHKAIRNPEAVLTLLNSTDVTDRQRERFLGESASLQTSELSTEDILTDGDYKVKTAYIRVGYFIKSDYGTFAPFAFFDWMDNPETIAKKTYGGDNESGISDDGKFVKWTLGCSYKPIDKVAIKLDTSRHIQNYNGKSESYPEVRFDISYLFK